MDYSELLDSADRLKTQVITIGTEGSYSDAWYRPDRDAVMESKEVQHLVPKVIRNSRNTSDVLSHLKGIASGNGSWAARRAYAQDEFAPLLSYLEEQVRAAKSVPHAESVDESLSFLDSAEVSRLWKKALSRAESDPEGAITAARSLLESTCKHILDELVEPYTKSTDAPTLYGKVARQLNLSPAGQTEQPFREALQGIVSTVNGISAVANAHGDRHGGGKTKAKPSLRHARFAVNSAGTVCAFLVESWQARNAE